MENISESAVRLFSPPESASRRFGPLSGGWALIISPPSNGLSGFSSSSSADPPPDSSL